MRITSCWGSQAHPNLPAPMVDHLLNIKSMSTKLQETIRASAHKLGEHIEKHQLTPEVKLPAHIRAKRAERAALVDSKRIIYLDTNAWKCLADFQQAKPRLTPAMIAFAQAMESHLSSGKYVFPIGLPTFFELDLMKSEATHDALVELVDQFSLGYCIAPFSERIAVELLRLRHGDFSAHDGTEDFLCSPIELLGIPAASFGNMMSALVDENTFNKALFDTISELPFSLQLEVGRMSQGNKWNNSAGILSLNQGKQEHQAEIENLNTGIFIELRGIIDAYCEAESVNLQPQERVLLALTAQYHWHQKPNSKAFPTLRILASLYGLMRFDSQRRYKDGDLTDFLAAASSLSIAEALFTDRRLAILIDDPRISLRQFNDRTVVSGFDEMANYLSRLP